MREREKGIEKKNGCNLYERVSARKGKKGPMKKSTIDRSNT